jgi:hypothetical protein
MRTSLLSLDLFRLRHLSFISPCALSHRSPFLSLLSLSPALSLSRPLWLLLSFSFCVPAFFAPISYLFHTLSSALYSISFSRALLYVYLFRFLLQSLFRFGSFALSLSPALALTFVLSPLSLRSLSLPYPGRNVLVRTSQERVPPSPERVPGVGLQ